MFVHQCRKTTQYDLCNKEMHMYAKIIILGICITQNVERRHECDAYITL